MEQMNDVVKTMVIGKLKETCEPMVNALVRECLNNVIDDIQKNLQFSYQAKGDRLDLRIHWKDITHP